MQILGCSELQREVNMRKSFKKDFVRSIAKEFNKRLASEISKGLKKMTEEEKKKLYLGIGIGIGLGVVAVATAPAWLPPANYVAVRAFMA